jgi:hypothetical protein
MSENNQLSWTETLSEWTATAGVGSLPLLCHFLGLAVTLDPKIRTARESGWIILAELLLFCVVTNAASVLIYLSKYNVLTKVSRGVRPLPVGLLFCSFPMLICNIFVLEVLIVPFETRLFSTLGCITGTTILTLTLERWIGNTAHALRLR